MKKLQSLIKPALATIIGLLIVSLVASNHSRKWAVAANTTMITTPAQNHGGTGVVLVSSENKSLVLTNRHVCKAVENGGVVLHRTGTYQVVDYVESVKSDLCIISVNGNLQGYTTIASSAPSMYEHAKISGHPALMPNVISEGHVSGMRVIQVVTGMKKCTEEDIMGPNGLLCAILGGMPIVESFESRLVTATIMPGSSGSAVYGSNNALIGLVFAGQGDLGYAWTVPYEQVVAFINNEFPKATPVNTNNLLDISASNESSLVNLKNKCANVKQTKQMKLVNDVCRLLKRDVTL